MKHVVHSAFLRAHMLMVLDAACIRMEIFYNEMCSCTKKQLITLPTACIIEGERLLLPSNYPCP
jgi:hypothetical protein